MSGREDYISALSDLPQAVFVITCYREDGSPHGFTATSVTSVTVNPPTLMVWVNENNAGATLYEPGMSLAMHVLGAQQGELSDRFAGRHGETGADKFKSVDWDREDSAPLLKGTADVFIGTVERKEPYHDHRMVGVGVDCVINRERAPLIYMASDYHQLQAEHDRLQSS